MKIKILTREQLESIIYTWFTENENCVIELQDEKLGGSIYFTSNRLPNNTINLSMCVGENSIGDIIMPNDGRARMEFIKDKCDIIDFENAHIVAYLKTEQPQIPNNKFDYYFNKEVKKKTPILIKTLKDALELFVKFLLNEECTKIIFTFTVPIPELDYQFKLDYVIDKYELYGKQMLSFTFSRYSGFAIPLDIDGFWEINNFSDDLINDIIKFCKETILHLFKRCMYVSEEEVELYVYSNCELI